MDLLALKGENPNRRLLTGSCVFLAAVATFWTLTERNVAAQNFLPHWYCFLGNRPLIYTHLISDALIFLSYTAISLTLGYLVWRANRGIPFHWVILAFGTFIIACGATHLMEVITLFRPIYWASAYVKVITAIASLSTAAVLPFVVPVALAKMEAAQTSEERKVKLEAANSELEVLTKQLRQMDELKDRFVAQQAAKIGSWSWDIESGRVHWSEEVEIMHGYAKGQFLRNYEGWRNTIHPEDREMVDAALRDALAGRGEYDVEYRTLRPDNGTYWTAARGTFLSDPAGRATRLLGICMDVSTRRQAQLQMERQARILDLANDAITALDMNGVIKTWNRGAEIMYGWHASEATGKVIHDLLQTTYPFPIHQITEDLLNNGQWSGEVNQYTRTGEALTVGSRWTLELDERKQPIGWIEINRDISKQKQSEALLQRSEKLAAAGRLAATIAHEINNPLEAVMNLLYLARLDETTNPQVKEFIAEAETQLSRVSHLARKTLGFYRESARPVDTDVTAVLEETLALYSGKFQTKSIKVQKEYSTPSSLITVPGELMQIFSNLIANAIDASNQGSTIRIRVKAGNSWNHSVRGLRITIGDSGTGIEPENRRSVFEPFFTTKKEVGTGLGLWVSQELVRKHRGTIRMKTSIGQRHGTVFAVFLPIKEPAKAIRGDAS